MPRAIEGLDAAIDRAKAYADAGADLIFTEALTGPEEFEAFRKAVDLPLLANMTEFGKSTLLSANQLEDLGFNAVIYPVTTLRLAMYAIEVGLREIDSSGTQSEIVETHAAPQQTVRAPALPRLQRVRPEHLRLHDPGRVSMSTPTIHKGLAGVVVDTTAISKVVQETNSLTYRGYPVQDLAARCSFEEVAFLLWHGELPSDSQLQSFTERERSYRRADRSLLSCSTGSQTTAIRWTSCGRRSVFSAPRTLRKTTPRRISTNRYA